MQQPNSSQAARQTLVRRLSGLLRKRWLLLVGVLLLLVIIVSAWQWYSSRSVIDRQLVSEADFSVYAPKQAPAGYQLRDDQTSLGSGILSYGFTSPSSDKGITVTVQPKPDGFDVSQMVKGGSINSTVTDNGTLYNLSIGGASQYLLDTGDSLVYLTSPNNIDTATINSLANSLSKLN